MIVDGSHQSNLDPRDSFYIQRTLLPVALGADACSLPYLNADDSSDSNNGERTSEQAQYGAETDSLAFLAAGGENLGLDRTVSEPNGLSTDARLSNGNISGLNRVKSRLANIGNCLRYFEYLLETIEVFFASPQGNVDAVLDQNIESGQANLLYLKTTRPVADKSDSAAVMSSFLPNHRLLNTYATTSNAPRSKLARSSSSRTDTSSTKRRKSGSPTSVKITTKDFIIYIFSQIRTYILIVVVSVLCLFIYSRT